MERGSSVRVGKDAECTVSDTIFWQDKFFPGWGNFISDIVNQYDPILIPGNLRAAYCEKGGTLELNNCYFSSMFLYRRGKINGKMTKDKALELVEELERKVPRLR